MRTRVATVVGLWCASAVLGAVQMTIDPRGVTEAIVIGQSRSERDRARYHAPYRLVVGRAPLDYLDVVTPFRRVVLAAETRARVGDPSFGQRQGLDTLAPAPAQIDLWLEFSFHPLNTYVGVPAYQVTLVDARGARTQVRAIDRRPRYGARVDSMPQPFAVPGGALPGGSQPMLGGTVIAQFDGRLLAASGVYDMVVDEAGKELARVRLDLARFR